VSRIQRPRVNPGEVIDSTDINNTYNDYQQPGALDANNTRDQAFGLPHFDPSVRMVKKVVGPVLLGTGDKAHPGATFVTVPALAGGTAAHIISDGAGNPTFLNMASDPMQMVPGDCLRLWWNLSMEHDRNGTTPYLRASAMGRYTIPNLASPPGQVIISDGFHFWCCWLQWDITSAALGNFVAVPDQSNIVTNVKAGYNGMLVRQMGASTTVSPWMTTSFGFADAGRMPAGNQGQIRDHGYFAPYGMWAYESTTTFTIYGIRLVVAGIFHPRSDAVENFIALDYTQAADNELHYTSGRMQAIQMRML